MCVCFFWRFSGERRKPFQFQGASLDICASFDCSRLKVMDGEGDKMFKQQLVIAKGNKGTSHSNVATLLLLHFSFCLGQLRTWHRQTVLWIQFYLKHCISWSRIKYDIWNHTHDWLSLFSVQINKCLGSLWVGGPILKSIGMFLRNFSTL